MKAIQISKFGGPEVCDYTDVPVPECGDGQVLVRIAIAGINYLDNYTREGIRAGPLPFILGSEGAGTIAEVGANAGDAAVGDTVVFRGSVTGAYAEYAVVPAWLTYRVPDGIALEVAVTLHLQGMTAHYLANDVFPVAAAHTCLIHAGAGGVGQIAIQLAKAQGARVLVTVGSEEKAAFAREIGADEAILYEQVDFVEAARELTDGEGVHAVYDSVGAATWEGSLKALRVRGKVAYFGGASGPLPDMALSILAAMGSLSVIRTALRDYVRDSEEIAWRTGEMFDLWRDGRMKVKIGHTYKLAEAGTAQADLQGRRSTGKWLLKP